MDAKEYGSINMPMYSFGSFRFYIDVKEWTEKGKGVRNVTGQAVFDNRAATGN